MIRRCGVLRAGSVDPFLNIALELKLFQSLAPDTHVLFLWRNSPSVIIGRNQNAWKEVNVDELDKRGVELVRTRRHFTTTSLFPLQLLTPQSPPGAPL